MRPDTAAATIERIGVSPTPESPLHGVRSDLVGLSAIAVGMIVLTAFSGQPAGGNVGIDVQFVVAGYLLTQAFLPTLSKGSRAGVRLQLARGARRLTGPLLLIVAVTTAMTLLVSTVDAQQTFVDAILSLALLTNAHLAWSGAVPQPEPSAASPLHHLWPIAVGVQVVLASALVAYVALAASRAPRSARTARVVVSAVLVALVVTSFVWALHESVADPEAAYFLLFSRAWEMGAGGLLAVAAPAMRHRPRLVAPAASVTGLTLIITSAILLEPGVTYPAPWALVPVTGTLMLIAGGINTPTRHLDPLLTTRTLGYLGLVSGSVYLWHWPVAVLSESLVMTNGFTRTVGQVAVVAVLGVATYYWVQRPGSAPARRPTAVHEHTQAQRAMVARISVLVVLCAATAVLCYLAILST